MNTIDFIIDVYVKDRGAHPFVRDYLQLAMVEHFAYGIAVGALAVVAVGFGWNWK